MQKAPLIVQSLAAEFSSKSKLSWGNFKKKGWSVMAAVHKDVCVTCVCVCVKDS